MLIPRGSKEVQWIHWTGWIDDPVTLRYSALPVYPTSCSLIQNSLGKMLVIVFTLCPFWRECPECRHQYVDHCIGMSSGKKKNFFLTFWFTQKSLTNFSWVSWAGQSCALWKHRQNKMFCPIRLTTTWGSRQDNAWRLNQSRSVPFSSIILWHQHSITHLPSPHVALCHRCRNSPNFPSKTQYGPLNVYQSRLQGTRRQKHLKNFL